MIYYFSSCKSFQENDKFKIYDKEKTWNFYAIFKKDSLETLDSFILISEKGSIFLAQQRIKYLYSTLLPNGSIRKVEEATGVVENDKKVWIHPPRSERFVFTEITPFPEFVFNVQEWNRKVNILKQDSFSGSVESNYKYLGIRDTLVNEIAYDSLHLISATSSSKYGNSIARFYFHNKLGFVYFYYLKPDGEEVFVFLDEHKSN